MSFFDELDGRQHCRNAPLNLFFPTARNGQAVRPAKQLCNGCPFRTPCLQYAVRYKLRGVWGGTTEQERRAYQRAHGITPIPVQIPRELSGARVNQNGPR